MPWVDLKGLFPDWVKKSDMFIYDIRKNSWSQVGVPLPVHRAEHVAVVLVVLISTLTSQL